MTINASGIVPGDLVLLDAGQIVPADMRLVEAARLRIEEAALTGESFAVDKYPEAILGGSCALGDRRNMAYKGTIVAYGRGRGIVTATGMETELGRIASMLQDEEGVQTPLQKRLAVFGKKIAVAVLAICAVVFGVGLMRGEPTVLMLLTAISLAVAAIPEALPAVVTISLALGAKKMVKQNALIRKLPAVETLGSVTYICSDKTGTLTMNRMAVEDLYIQGHRIATSAGKFFDTALGGSDDRKGYIRYFMSALALCNDTQKDPSGRFIGDPTETALVEFVEKYAFRKGEWEVKYPRVAELPFDSVRKCMTTVHAWDDGYISFTKGAVDEMTKKAEAILSADGGSATNALEILKASDAMAADGLRVLCIAMRRWNTLPSKISPETFETDFTILGLVGMMDPPRDEAEEAVRICKAAGIRPVMITGDHPLTAESIGKRLGIIENDSQSVLTGSELERLSLEDFEQQVEHIGIYARVAPEQKLKIIRALQDKGHYVAMTGDGVNDAPALKRADIGVAMGITGTDVSKEASHMILLDDNFATIVKAVREGRRIFDNIRKFIKYTMTSNSGEIYTLFLAPFFGLPIPLLPIHILWINLVTDGIPGLALAAEPGERNIMGRPPRDPKESIFAEGLGTHIIWVGLLMGAVTIMTQALFIDRSRTHWQTMVFTVLCLSQMGHVLAIRSEQDSLFKQGVLSNKPLLGAVVLTFVLQLATIYMPWANSIFKTQPLTPMELFISIVLSLVVFVVVEVEKWVKRRNIRQKASFSQMREGGLDGR